MNYLTIINNGLIEPEDLYLIGSSTKRQDESKIGMFGSGWKFALAWLMRNDCMPDIYSGETKIDVDFKMVLHRNIPVKVITINGKETSLTSEMGIKWTGWMALREIVSNAIDEGGYDMFSQYNPKGFNLKHDKTTIRIPMNNELANVLRGFNKYFSYERKPSFENEIGRVYFRNTEDNMSIYRKGIRCFDSELITKTDFDFNDIEINESRLTSTSDIRRNIRKMIRSELPLEVFKKLINDNLKGQINISVNDNILENLKKLIEIGEVFTCPLLENSLASGLVKNPTMIIPNEWYKHLAKEGLINNPFSKMFSSGAPDGFIQTNNRDFSGIKYYLEGLNLYYNYYSGVFDGDTSVYKNDVYINDNFTEDDKYIASKVLYGTSRMEFERQMK